MKHLSSLALIAFVASTLLTGCNTTGSGACHKNKAAMSGCGAGSCSKATPCKTACSKPCCAKTEKKS